MAKFDCPCGGKITPLTMINDSKFIVIYYGCNACHLVWFDTPENPLSQISINITKAWVIREFNYRKFLPLMR